VIPNPTNFTSPQLSYSQRISHDLDLYHKLDTEILYDAEALRRYQAGTLVGNIVILDGAEKTTFGQQLLLQNRTDIRLNGESLFSNEISLDGPSKGIIRFFLHATLNRLTITQALRFYIHIPRVLAPSCCSFALLMKREWNAL
jgi:hypothetical protein